MTIGNVLIVASTSFAFGMFTEFLILALSNKITEYSQTCENCKYTRPSGGITRMSFVCGHPKAYYVDTPVEPHWTCGHFEFTDTIKERQFQAKLAKMKKIPTVENSNGRREL